MRIETGISILNFNTATMKKMFPEGTELCYESTEKTTRIVPTERRTAMFLYKGTEIHFNLKKKVIASGITSK